MKKFSVVKNETENFYLKKKQLNMKDFVRKKKLNVIDVVDLDIMLIHVMLLTIPMVKN